MQLARSWTLPLTIASGLAATYAVPWDFQNNTGYVIFATLVPLMTQAVLSAVTAVMAFMGKSAWLPLQISTTAIAFINSLGFSLGIWGVTLPELPLSLLWITTLPLVGVLIWGRKEVGSRRPPLSSSPNVDQSEW